MAGLDLMMYKDGIKEDREEGMQQGKLDLLVRMVKDNIISIADAAKRLGISEKEFLKFV